MLAKLSHSVACCFWRSGREKAGKEISVNGLGLQPSSSNEATDSAPIRLASMMLGNSCFTVFHASSRAGWTQLPLQSMTICSDASWDGSVAREVSAATLSAGAVEQPFIERANARNTM